MSARAPKSPDPLLITLLAAQRLVPIVALAAYVRGYRPAWLVAAGVVAWAVAMLQTVRTAAVSRVARRQAVTDAAWGIARRSVGQMRGGAHDGLLELIWRGIEARAALAAETMPSVVASLIALPIAFAVAVVIDGRWVATVTVISAIVGVVVRIPLARWHARKIVALNAIYRILAIDLGHGLRALEDLQAHGLSEAYASQLEGHAARLAAADAEASRAGRAAMLGPLLAGSVVFVAILSPSIASREVGLVHLATLLVLGPVAIGLARGIVQRTRQRSDSMALDALANGPPDLAPPPSPGVRIDALMPLAWSHVTFRHGARATAAKATAPHHDDPSAAVFEDVSLVWDGRRPLAVLGPNGSGKSTLLMLLLRLDDPTEGVVTLGGVDLRVADPRALRPRLAYVPQRPLLLEGMTVGEAMRLVAPAATDAALLSALERVGLAVRLRTRDVPPLDVACSSLSVGEGQRIAIARAIARDAELLVLDEPEAGLDPVSRADLRVLLEQLAAEGKQIVLATQHAEVLPAGALTLRLPLAAGTRWAGEPASDAATSGAE